MQAGVYSPSPSKVIILCIYMIMDQKEVRTVDLRHLQGV